MRTFAQKLKAPMHSRAASLPMLGRARSQKSWDVNLLHRLHRAIGNQAVERWLEQTRDLEANSTPIKVPPSGHEFSRIPVQEQGPVDPSERLAAGANPMVGMLRGLQAARDASTSPGAGEPLPPSEHEAMSARFGYDLSRVRIHTGSEAARAAGARAFTSGEHVWFGPGHGPAESALLSHELAHVVQQATGEARFLGDARGDLAANDRLERGARTGSVPRPSGIGRMASRRPFPAPQHPAVIQFDFEEDTLRELHRLPAVEEEGISKDERRRRVRVLAARYQRLLVLFASLPRDKADEIWERLHERRKGDVLSERFHDMLATQTRKDLIQALGLKGYAIRQYVPDPADFCRPFSKREIDQDIDFEMQNEMDRFVNGDLRDFWGDEAADLFDRYLTSTERNVTPVIFDKQRSQLVQSFINHEATAKRERELAAIIEKNLTDECGYGLPPNEWIHNVLASSIFPEDLKAPFSFSGFDTIPAIVAGGVSSGPGVVESRSAKVKEALVRRVETGGVTTGVQLRVQFSFVVKDAIDFCPGNMGGFFASYVTIPFSRLEASGMAFPVPFQVHYDGPVLEIDLGPAAVKACTPKGRP
jgi:hypothetical protein